MTLGQFFARSRAFGLSRRRMAAIVGLALAVALAEAIGVGLMLPVLQFIQEAGDVSKLADRGRIWRALVDVSQATGVPLTLATLLLLSFAFLLLRQIVTYAQHMTMARVRLGLVRDARARLFRTFLATSLGRQEQEKLGGLINDATVEVENAVSGLLLVLHQAALVLLALAYFALLLAVSATMTLAAAGVFVITALLLRGLIGRSIGIGRLVTEANQSLGGFLAERLRSLRLIRLAGTEAAEARAVDDLVGRQQRHRLEAERLNAALQTAVEPVFIAFAFGLLYFGLTALGMRFEEIALFLIAVLRLVPIGKDTLRARQNVLQLVPSIEAVERRLQRLAADAEPPGGELPAPAAPPALRFEDVTFVYDGGNGRPALSGASFDCAPGTMTALVGPSGGGKSTLIDILVLLRRPAAGRVLIDGSDSRDYALDGLRRAVAYVPQAPQLFDVTAAEHIRYGRADATEAELREAAQRAGALAFLDAAPEGFALRLGEGGARLSGGQRQRLDLARALVRRAPILLLDEPTSNLDADAEHAVLDVLKRLRAEKAATMIVIAHRLATVAMADQIVVLESGRVAARGTHRELVAAGGWYAEAFARQAGPPAAGTPAAGAPAPARAGEAA
jgi:ATP-binding cassette, subfamily B, bacterial MsbA